MSTALRSLESIAVPASLQSEFGASQLECWVSTQSPAVVTADGKAKPASWITNNPDVMNRIGAYIWLIRLANGTHQYLHVGQSKDSMRARTKDHVDKAYIATVPQFSPCSSDSNFLNLTISCANRREEERCLPSKARTNAYLQAVRVLYIALPIELDSRRRHDAPKKLEGLIDAITYHGGWRNTQTTNDGGTQWSGYTAHDVAAFRSALNNSLQMFPSPETEVEWRNRPALNRRICKMRCAIGA